MCRLLAIYANIYLINRSARVHVNSIQIRIIIIIVATVRACQSADCVSHSCCQQNAVCDWIVWIVGSCHNFYEQTQNIFIPLNFIAPWLLHNHESKVLPSEHLIIIAWQCCYYKRCSFGSSLPNNIYRIRVTTHIYIERGEFVWKIDIFLLKCVSVWPIEMAISGAMMAATIGWRSIL